MQGLERSVDSNGRRVNPNDARRLDGTPDEYDYRFRACGQCGGDCGGGGGRY